MAIRETHVYTLADESGAVHYVGQSWNVRERLANHQYVAKTRKNALYQWMDDYTGKIVVSIVETVRDIGWNKSEAERRWILKLRAEGHPLKNIWPRNPTPSRLGRFKFASQADQMKAANQTLIAVREAVDILEKERG